MTSDAKSLETAEIIHNFPDEFDPSYNMQSSGANVTKNLIGSKIIGFGFSPGIDVEGGGLIVDYIPEGCDKQHRIVLGFNELGMWVEWQCEKPTPAGASQ